MVPFTVLCPTLILILKILIAYQIRNASIRLEKRSLLLSILALRVAWNRCLGKGKGKQASTLSRTFCQAPSLYGRFYFPLHVFFQMWKLKLLIQV